MKRLDKRFARWMLLGMIAAALLGFAMLALLSDAGAPAVRRAEARARWAARPFSEYRLVVQETARGESCDQDVQVQQEQIRHVFQNGCVRLASWTISNLFTWAEHLDGYKTRCYPTDVTCVCHMIYSAHTLYDPGLGYPQSVTYQWELQPNWGYLNHWKRLWQTGELPDCNDTTRHANGHIMITVVSLTPLR